MNETKKLDLVLIGVNSPTLCGVYENFQLQKSFFSIQRTGDALLEVFTSVSEYLQDKPIRAIFYARGPGSFTSLKLTHIFLQTLQLHKGFELYSTDSFYFNENAPIKAFGNKFFLKNPSGEIEIEQSHQHLEKEFFLPQTLMPDDFDSHNVPLYILPPL